MCIRDRSCSLKCDAKLLIIRSIVKKTRACLLYTSELHIYTRDYRANEGKIEIDIRDVNDQELNMIYEKIVKIIGGRKDE